MTGNLERTRYVACFLVGWRMTTLSVVKLAMPPLITAFHRPRHSPRPRLYVLRGSPWPRASR
jgi:hypothetical protein